MPIGAFKLNSIGRYLAPTGRTAVALTVGSSISISTTQSKFGGSSILFANANTDIYGTVYPSAPITFGTGDFTVEFWIYPTGTNTTAGIITKRNYNNVADGTWGIYYNGSTRAISWQNIFSTGGVTTHTSSTAAFSLNAWSHWAFVRSGSTLTIYVNGTSVGSFSNSLNFNYQDQPIRIGDWDGSANNGLAGNLDEIRISSVARYTAAFTAPSSPFVNDSNTLLLIHADGANGSTNITDDAISTQRNTITAYGNAQVSTAQSKFGVSSLSLDGTGDYLQVPYASQFSFTGDFTIELFFRANSYGTYNTLITSWSPGWYLSVWSSNSIYFYANNNQIIGATGLTFSINTWYHIAVSRSGTSVKMFRDGTQIGSTGTLSGTVSADDPILIGENYDNGVLPAQYLNGYIDEVRISNSARYTDNFTAPTASFVNDSNTLLLIHCDGTNASTTFTDDTSTSQRTARTVTPTNVTVATAQSKFGGASAVFNPANTPGLEITSATDFTFGTSDFTVEAWIYVDSVAALRVIWGSNSTAQSMSFYVQTNRSLNFYTPATGQIAGLSNGIALNTWTHVALSRSSGTTRGFINGSQAFSTTTVWNATGALNAWIGRESGGSYFSGYIDEIRVSNTARYTGTFTAPTARLVNDSNTLLLVHADGSNGSTTFTDDNA